MNSITKVCKVCNIEKDVSDFYFNKSTGCFEGKCKSCSKARRTEARRNSPEQKASAVMCAARWKKENPEKAREQNKNYIQRNIDKVKAAKKAWLQTENGKEYKKRWRQSENGKASRRIWEQSEKGKASKKAWLQSENGKEYKKRWKQSPVGKICRAIERHVRRSKTHGKFTPTEWSNLCSKYDNKCLCCGERKKLTVDHVVPIALGGANTIDNIQPLCLSCNSKKNKKIIDYRKDSP